jgi:hypothetical protein
MAEVFVFIIVYNFAQHRLYILIKLASSHATPIFFPKGWFGLAMRDFGNVLPLPPG